MVQLSTPGAMTRNASPPIVSVGIPTYSRPDGLRRALTQICGQTYSNLEIVVSDNASPGRETSEVIAQFSARDSRINWHRQAANIGAWSNFKFVLAKATGEYFMWAADDDEWDPSFVERCVELASPTCSVMTGFDTILRAKGVRQGNAIPSLSPGRSAFENARQYLDNMQPSLIYGLHPRHLISFALTLPQFDFFDCYLVLRVILEGGFQTRDEVLYSAGVDEPVREIKYADASQRQLRFQPFLTHSLRAIMASDRLAIIEKGLLAKRLVQTVRVLRKHHAGSR
jgi:glycosyltransferase involved in cell wall biosynthesis